jgi:glycerophosphoryl diester phosphodiesterase
MVELKYYGPDPQLIPSLAAIVERYDGPTEVILMSLDLGAVNTLQNRLKGFRVGYVSTLAIGQVTRLKVDFLALARNRVNTEILRSARKQGIEIYAWTPNQVDQIAELIELGVDGIITDFPRRARAVESEINSMNSVERYLLRFRHLLIEGVDDMVEGDDDEVAIGESEERAKDEDL